MCGIAGYVGKRAAAPLLIEGLKRLEYRGYDSAGLALNAGGQMYRAKAAGKVAALEKNVNEQADMNKLTGCGIAHTRWATHGAPTAENAHPHFDAAYRFAVVHNGIIENYQELRSVLEKKGVVFRSQTDSEVLPHLIAEAYEGDLLSAVAAALKQVKGTYGIAVVSTLEPDKIITARNGSPIVIGIGDKENLIASDVAPLLPYTSKVIYLNDGDIAMVTPEKIDVPLIADFIDFIKNSISSKTI